MQNNMVQDKLHNRYRKEVVPVVGHFVLDLVLDFVMWSWKWLT